MAQNNFDEIKRQMEAQAATTQKAIALQQRTAKMPAVNAMQAKTITADQYQELVGEPFADTMKEFYMADLENIREKVSTRVKNGLLTPEQYKGITGEEYPEEVPA